MAPKYETPTVKAGASRDFLGGPSRDSLTLAAHRVQFLITAGARPELAVMLAILIFGGGGQ
jgi:hypothetical protein